MTELSVVIVVSDDHAWLRRSLPAAVAGCRGVEHEVVIVDNATPPGALSWLGEPGSDVPPAEVVRLPARTGLSAARNAGFAAASGEFVLFLDADAELFPGAAEALVRLMRERHDVGIAGPKMLYPDGRLQESARPFQTWASFARRGLRMPPRAKERRAFELLASAREPFEADWVLGACQLARRRAAEDVGPMDERFRLYYGDVDWCMRTRRAGWKVMVEPRATCSHAYRRRSAGFPNRWTLAHVADFLRFRTKADARPVSVRADLRPVRVLHLMDLLGVSGPAVQLAALLRGIDRSRFRPVGIVTLVRSPGDRELAREMGLPFACFGKRGLLDKYARVPLVLRRLVRRLDVDLVHAEHFKMGMLAAFMGRLTGAATVVTQSISCDRDGRYSRRDMALWRMALRLADRVVVNADSLRRYCVEKCGAGPERVRTVLYGVDVDRFGSAAPPARDALGVRDGAHVLCVVARLEPQKGHVHLLRALTRLPSSLGPVDLLVAGEGSEEAALKAEAAALGPQVRVRFLGARRDVAAILALCDAFVLPSLWEGMPLAVMEAMAAGVPVVATAVDGTAELVEDGVSGVLVPPGDEAALAAAVERVLRDRDEAVRMAAAAKERVRRLCGLERMVRKMESVYEEALASARKRRSAPSAGSRGQLPQ